MIETRYGTLLAPELNGKSFFDDDLLWTNFEVNHDNQPYSDATTVSNLVYMQVYSSYIRTVPGGIVTDEYTAPIDHMYPAPALKAVRKILFCSFGHVAPADQTYAYEMFYDPEETADTPTLYVRAKKSNSSTGSNINLKTCWAFEMTTFATRYKDPSSNIVQLNIKYRTGVDDEGKDIYKTLEGSPISWELPTN